MDEVDFKELHTMAVATTRKAGYLFDLAYFSNLYLTENLKYELNHRGRFENSKKNFILNIKT